jgi:molybdopterin molybdotransferase
MISVAEAVQIVRQQTPVLASETVQIEAAMGRVLAQDIVADSDLPPFDRSQMDGYAVRAEDVKSAPVQLRIGCWARLAP